MRTWQEKLPESQRNVLQEIVNQIPETMGVRDAIENILDNLASGGTAPKFRFVIVGGPDDVEGTNDEDKALELSDNDDLTVVDTINGVWIMNDGDDNSDITETKL